MRTDKYDNYDYPQNENSIKDLLMSERLIWSGKPKRNAFILNKSVKMMPFNSFVALF